MTLDPDAINYFKDNTILENPYDYFAALRERNPITREPYHDVMMCTGFDEATLIYNDDRFSSATSVTGPFPGFPVPLEGDDITAIIEQYRDGLPFSDQLPTLDPPVHTEHRGLLMRMITPKRLKENEEFMWRLADRLIDAFIADGSCEFIDAFAQPFAMLVIADLLGVPEEEHANFRKALLEHDQGGALGGTAQKALGHSPLEYLYGRFSEFISDRRANPRNDVLTEMAQLPFPSGGTPEVMDVVKVAANLFAAGQETTVRLISSGLKILGDDKALQQELRDDRLLIPNFVEECLRLEAPVKGDFRLSKVPVDVAGVHIPAGTQVMVLNAALNRDPRKFENPNALDPRRANARTHVAFGRGPHTCPGAPLARAESVVAFNRLFDRTKDIRISEAHHGPADARRYNYVPTFILRGLTNLHVEFDPADGQV